MFEQNHTFPVGIAGNILIGITVNVHEIHRSQEKIPIGLTNVIFLVLEYTTLQAVVPRSTTTTQKPYAINTGTGKKQNTAVLRGSQRPTIGA